MSDSPEIDQLSQVEAALLKRWPESRIEPTLDRISALLDALGSPQLSYPTIHLAGTNGKTTTSRMIDQLLTNLGYRVGRYTSPHLESLTERISIKGSPITPAQMIATYKDIELYLDLIDSRQPHPISFFEAMTAMAFVAFAEHPVDVGVIEAGMGGQWDATNVLTAQVAVMTPIGFDHMEYLGDTLTKIAQTKSGIFKPESNVVMAAQPAEAAKVLMAQLAKVSAIPFREGVEFSVKSRALAVGGQLISLQGLHGEIDDIYLPLYGLHQANNAAVALAAVEAFTSVALDKELVREAFSKVASTINDEFDFELVEGVVAVLADKDVAGILEALSTCLDYIVISQSSSARAMPAQALAEIAGNYFRAEQIEVISDLAAAITYAVEKVSLANQVNDGVGAVLVTGSVVTAGFARTKLKELGSGK